MNKLAEQAELVKEALRAGQKVAVAVPRERMFERVAEDFIPEDLPMAARPNRLNFRFKNGAVLSFIPSVMGDRGVRGDRFNLALYYPAIYGEPMDRERIRRCIEMLREHAEKMHELEMP